jgi:hypothetical protein
MKRGVRSVAAGLALIALLPLMLAACRSHSVRTVDRAEGIEVFAHSDRLVGKYDFRWYTVRIDGVEAAIGEPWYDAGQRRFQRVDLVQIGEVHAAVVKVLGTSRESAYSHYMTFLVEPDGQGGIAITRLSPAGRPGADGLDVHWPVPGRADR